MGKINKIRCLVMASNPFLMDFRTFGDSGRTILLIFINALFYHNRAPEIP
jgi:hypothetical protein